MKETQFNRLFLFCCSLVPALMIAADYLRGEITDQQTMMHNTGICALIFLALSLLITPLRRLTGKNSWSLYRRQLGLYAFFYACLHVLIYTFLRHGGSLPKAIREIFENQFIFFGFAAFTLMLPLVATSTAWAIKKMGNKKWKLLHKLVYLAAISASIHYLLSGKVSTASFQLFFTAIAGSPLKLLFASIFAALLLFRLVAWLRDRFFPKAPKSPRPALAAQ